MNQQKEVSLYEKFNLFIVRWLLILCVLKNFSIQLFSLLCQTPISSLSMNFFAILLSFSSLVSNFLESVAENKAHCDDITRKITAKHSKYLCEKYNPFLNQLLELFIVQRFILILSQTIRF
jgi:hypothetical protein